MTNEPTSLPREWPRRLRVYFSWAWQRYLVYAALDVAAYVWWPKQLGRAITAGVTSEVGIIVLLLLYVWSRPKAPEAAATSTPPDPGRKDS